MNYPALKTELQTDPLGRGYAEMTAQQAADSLNAVDRPATRTRFGSYRTLAAILDGVEYATAKAVLAAAGQQDARVADMDKMLAMPGDDSGNGGGVDFGHPSVRGMVDVLFASYPTVAAKLKAIGETLQSRATELGLGTVGDGHVVSAREMF